MMSFLRHACTAAYRLSVVALLLLIASELAQSNQFLIAIFMQLVRAFHGVTT